MQLCSTNDVSKTVSLREAVLKGLPEDNGLFMPVKIPVLTESFFSDRIFELSFPEIAFEVTRTFFGDSIPLDTLKRIIFEAIDFPAPLVKIDDYLAILELFHGPSMAFKDFGARFMGQLMSYFNEGEQEELVILVATSGDTGGAVAAGFHNKPGIQVVILYPSGKVSELQEKQLTTYTGNVTAIEVQGTFDDCQALVKQAFLDQSLNEQMRLTSANSINIARLIPQMFYYFEAYRQVQLQYKHGSKLSFVVPSGNFGNLTAGLMAKEMGLPVEKFVAATNINDVVPQYLQTGNYVPRASERTLSNAMDVGAPSNFRRIEAIYSKYGDGSDGSTWNIMKEHLLGFAFNDEDTKQMMHECSKEHGYLLDPHTAVGVLAAREYGKNLQFSAHPHPCVVLSTAHPVKFAAEIEGMYFAGSAPDVPEQAVEVLGKEKKSHLMNVDFSGLKNFLLSNFKEC